MDVGLEVHCVVSIFFGGGGCSLENTLSLGVFVHSIQGKDPPMDGKKKTVNP